MKNNIALYIHWPYCRSKCPYCDFNSHVTNFIDHERFKQAYISELNNYSHILKDKIISSIYLGGGTPSLMKADIIETIISHLSKNFTLSHDIEITMEANPTSIEAKSFNDFKSAGVNRVSLGIQALNDQDLKFLGREHDSNEAKYAIEIAAKNFNNYSFDLIYARPEQKLEDWQNELKEALSLSANHLSLYQLTIEKGTKFYSSFKKGDFKMPNDSLARDFLDLTYDIMKEASMPPYEVSNFAKQGFESKHNISYWEYDDYLGIGPGAHSRISIGNLKHAIMMHSDPSKWLDNISKSISNEQINDILTDEDVLAEFIMMGLRLTKGISKNSFETKTNYNFDSFFVKKKYEPLIKNNLIEITSNKIFVKNKGFPLLNTIITSICTEN